MNSNLTIFLPFADSLYIDGTFLFIIVCKASTETILPFSSWRFGKLGLLKVKFERSYNFENIIGNKTTKRYNHQLRSQNDGTTLQTFFSSKSFIRVSFWWHRLRLAYAFSLTITARKYLGVWYYSTLITDWSTSHCYTTIFQETPAVINWANFSGGGMNITSLRLVDFSTNTLKLKDLDLTAAIRKDIQAGFITVCKFC